MNTGTTPLVGATVSLWSTGTAAAQVTGSASVTTNASGTFSIHYICPASSTLMYVVATGGHVGSGAANANISLTSALGGCGSLPTSIVVNELTTVASVYALSGFASAGTAPATVKFQGKSPGIDQAFNTLGNLTNTGTGAFETASPETNKTFVQQTLDTVANALAACNASTTTTTGPCRELYTCATPLATYAGSGNACSTSGSPTLATDTLSAALAITQNAGTVSTHGIYDLGTTTKPFSPALTTGSPNDWTLPLVYHFTNYGPLAIDASGHVWVLTHDLNAPSNTTVMLSELDANFNQLSTYSGGGLQTFDNTDTTNLAIDLNGNVWVGGGPHSDKLVEYSSVGVALSGNNGYSAGSGPDGTSGVAIDAAGDAWFASGNSFSSVFELGPTGTFAGSSSGIAASVCPCAGIAPDPFGNVWIISSPNNAQNPGNPGGARNQLAEVTGGAQTAAVSPAGVGVNATFYSIAADASGNFWITDQHNHGMWEYSTAAGFSGVSGLPFPNVAAQNKASHPKGIAIDGAGHKWIANQGVASPPSTTAAPSSLTELSADGATNLSPAYGFGSGELPGAYSVAIDGSGNVWVADGGTTITQFVGAAAPTKNPIVTAITSGFTP